VSASAAQEAEEDMALDVFRNASGLLAGVVTRVKPDPPDFLIANRARRVAVEMTRYHHDWGEPNSKGAREEVVERQVMAAAQTHFEALVPNVHVRVAPYFREGTLRSDNIQEVAERLAKLVAQVIPPAPSDAEPLTSVRVDWDAFNRVGLGEILINLSLYRWRRANQGEWLARVSGRVNSDVAYLERPLRSKEEDLASYQASFDECWLIIYAPPLHASSFFDFEVLTPGMFLSDFDQVVFIDVHFGHYRLIG
jgi:hypothetical protein